VLKFAQTAVGRVVERDVSGHQHPSVLTCEAHKLLALVLIEGERFLDQHILTSEECLPCDGPVRARRSCDDHRLD
jgi:hypothetical protein